MNDDFLDSLSLHQPLPMKRPKPREPLFIDCGGRTIRVNPRTTSTSHIGLQIITPPEYDERGHQLVEAKFFQMYLSADNVKKLADILHAEAVTDLFT